MMKKINALDYKENEIIPLEWEEDEIEFWFGDYEIYDTKEKRNNLKRIEKINSLGLGSNNRNIESILRKHKGELNWIEPKKEKKKYKKFDLINGYEEGKQWRIRIVIHSDENIGYSIEI